MLLNLSCASGMRVVPQPEGSLLVMPGKVTLEGSVRDAMKVLGLRDPMTVYRLIQDKDIKAWKPRNKGKNCMWRVDMASVTALKERRKREQEERA